MDMDDKEHLRKRGFKQSVRRAQETAQDKRKKLAEKAREREEEKEAERVREFNSRQRRLLGEKDD